MFVSKGSFEITGVEGVGFGVGVGCWGDGCDGDDVLG